MPDITGNARLRAQRALVTQYPHLAEVSAELVALLEKTLLSPSPLTTLGATALFEWFYSEDQLTRESSPFRPDQEDCVEMATVVVDAIESHLNSLQAPVLVESNERPKGSSWSVGDRAMWIDNQTLHHGKIINMLNNAEGVWCFGVQPDIEGFHITRLVRSSQVCPEPSESSAASEDKEPYCWPIDSRVMWVDRNGVRHGTVIDNSFPDVRTVQYWVDGEAIAETVSLDRLLPNPNYTIPHGAGTPQVTIHRTLYGQTLDAFAKLRCVCRDVADREGSAVRRQDAQALERASRICNDAIKNLSDLSSSEKETQEVKKP